jgi:hypothetical protein
MRQLGAAGPGRPMVHVEIGSERRPQSQNVVKVLKCSLMCN